MEQPTAQEGVVERVADGRADIRLDDQVLHWPAEQLPPHVKTGDKVLVLVTTAELERMDREALAKTILNEILSGEDSK